ncbi:MAG: hypothetical protein Q7S66_04930 [bacterium]|nr:hypothetical protein [bacterium]
MTIKSFIAKRPHLVWGTKASSRLSAGVVLESVLNYGDFDDVQKLFKIIGVKKAATIFRRQLKMRRNNYRPAVANYFKLYFEKHA